MRVAAPRILGGTKDQKPMNHLNLDPAEKEALVWRSLILALAGTTPLHQFDYESREDMKNFATGLRALYAEGSPAMRVGAWLVHSFAHWLRAHEILMTAWPADTMNEEFPNGINFRRYLCAWLAAVGVPQLGMTDADVEAVYEATGCAPIAHELLPRGKSAFTHPDLQA